MYSQKQLSILSEVQQRIINNSSCYDSYWNYSDNIGLLIQTICNINVTTLQRILGEDNIEYWQCNWKKLFDIWNEKNRDYYGQFSYDVECLLSDLFEIFTYEQLLEINDAQDESGEPHCFLTFLKGVLVNNEYQQVA